MLKRKMNDDLISRQAAIEYFMTNTNWHDENGYPIDDAEEKRKLLEDYFNSISSAEPKTGRWKHVEIESNMSDTGYFMLPLCECSVCEIYVEQESNYCPNCGADMRSKAREYLEYGELITKGIAQGLRGDSDE